MRPPEFTGGNHNELTRILTRPNRFNEAAGIHRRKLWRGGAGWRVPGGRFNEAAGIHRRKLPDKYPGKFPAEASMRPPEFTGGNAR